MKAAGYLRRSVADEENIGRDSRDSQVAAIVRLAERDGFAPDSIVWYEDWGKSADEAKEERREAWTRLLADVQARRVTHVYAGSTDRLYRSMRTFARLIDAAKGEKGKPAARIVTERGGVLAGASDDDDPMQWAFSQLTALFAELELRTIKHRARRSVEAKQARGWKMGQPPMGQKIARDDDGRRIFIPDPDRPVTPVLDAYREAGTVQGAAKLLNARGIPSPKGRTWGTSATKRVLLANGADLPARGRRGRVALRVPYLARLLRCHCGGILTPNVARGQYYCPRAKGRADHGRYNVTEASLLPWVWAEAVLPSWILERDTERATEERREALLARRRAIIEAAIDGVITREERTERVAAIDAELDAIEAPMARVPLPDAIDWDNDPPEAVNGVLRALWRFVELDADMRPVRADWRL